MARSPRPFLSALGLVLGALALYGVVSMLLPGPAQTLSRRFVNLAWPALAGLSALCFIRARGGPLGQGSGFRALGAFAGTTVAAFILVNALGLVIDLATHAKGEGGVGEPLLYLSVLLAPGLGAVAGWRVLRRAQ